MAARGDTDPAYKLHESDKAGARYEAPAYRGMVSGGLVQDRFGHFLSLFDLR